MNSYVRTRATVSNHLLVGSLTCTGGASWILASYALQCIKGNSTSRANVVSGRLTTPVMPRAMATNHSRPWTLPCAPCAAVASVAPRTMRSVVMTSAALRPMRSHTTPTSTWPMTSPVDYRSTSEMAEKGRNAQIGTEKTLTDQKSVRNTS